MFEDRDDAGRRLAALLGRYRRADVVALGLPRGGVPVAVAVARVLDVPLDVIVVRKLGLPHDPEVAMGAIGEGGARVVDAEFVRRARVGPRELAETEARESAVLLARARRWREGRPPVPLTDRTALVVDDGIATGATVRTAVTVARGRGAARVVVATPVAPSYVTAAMLDADELVGVERPPYLSAVAQFYRDFAPISDDEVSRLLRGSVPGPQSRATTGAASVADRGTRGARRSR